jgi:hypothetical protein
MYMPDYVGTPVDSSDQVIYDTSVTDVDGYVTVSFTRSFFTGLAIRC